MNRIHPHNAGLTLGFLAGGGHAVWSLFVWAGIAQPLIEFVLRLHMIAVPFLQVQPFDLRLATALVAFTSLGGYCIGYLIGAMLEWSAMHEVRRIRHDHPHVAMP
jgi:hypothetical protein